MDEDTHSHLAPPDAVSVDITDTAPEATHRSAVQRLGEAIIAVARRPTRAAYATWMRIIEPAWILPLLVTLVVLDTLNAAVNTALQVSITAPGATALHYRFGVPSLLDRVIYGLIIAPLVDLMSFALIVLLIAGLMPSEQGSLKERAIQVARPYLLAQLLVGLINLVINQPASALRRTTFGQIGLVDFALSVLDLAVGIYLLITTLNALAAGSGKSRLLIFGVSAVAVVVIVLIGWYGLGMLLYQFGIHLPIVL